MNQPNLKIMKYKAFASACFALLMLGTTAVMAQTASVRMAAEDKSHKPVTDLKLEELSFKVDGAPVAAGSVQYAGVVPVDWVLAVDCSNSMRLEMAWRPAIEAAAQALVSSMQERGDRVAIAAITDGPVHLQPFMSDGQKVTAAANQLHSGGATALYDSLLALADYLQTNSVSDRRQIVWVISDGEDNQSSSPIEKVLTRFEANGVPVLLSILGDSTMTVPSNGRGNLVKLARNSGGVVFTTNSKRESAEATSQIILFSKKEYRVVLPVQPGSRDHKLEAGVRRSGVKLLEAKRSIHVN